MVGGEKSSNKNDGNMSDHNSLLYLHPSDYLRQMQVNDALFDKNYTYWVTKMDNFLFAKNMIGFVDRTIEDYVDKERRTNVKGWPTTDMDKEIRTNV
uniref:Retrotransposon Copia-like N-terminal domain-containing protein n=1 Tax=Lactuca sativa TaxID=4236 RepID=A0A9R1WAX0_LACSA|nr:hypothetical protein LSAT_V11C200078000 [Lactuca sativa]